MQALTVPTPVQDVTARVHAAAAAGVGDLAPSTMRIPNWRYTDPRVAAAELRTTFTAPVVVAMSTDLPDAGNYRTLDALGMPLIVVRSQDAKVRVLLNACRHRGATLVDGPGGTTRFTCSYHGWSYDTEGSLVGLPDRRRGFSDVDPAELGLVEFPSEERHGFVWAVLARGAELDLDAHLGPLGDELAGWHLEDNRAVAQLDLELDTNWKSAVEPFQETYHFPYVHTLSLPNHGMFPNIVTFDSFGRHHRLGVPMRSIGTGAEPAPGEQVVCIYYIYPNTVIASSPLGGELFHFWPGKTPTTSSVRHRILSRFAESDATMTGFFEDYIPKMQSVIRDEDAVTLDRAGAGLAAGLTDVIIGRNEIGCQAVHRQLIEDLATEGRIEL